MTIVVENNIDDGLEPSEPVIHKPTGGFLRHAMVYGVGAVAIQVVSILLLPLYIRYLTAAEYGVLQLLYRVGDVLNLCLMVSGIQMAALNFWGKAETAKERKHVAATIGWLTFIVLMLCLGIVMAGAPFFAGQLGLYDTYSNAGMLLGFGVLAMMLQATTMMPLALMQARLESTAYLLTSLSIAACQLIAVSVSLIVFDAGVWGVVLAMATVFAFFGATLTVREFSKSTPIPDWGQMVRVIKFALPFVPSGLLFFILHSGDQFFLTRYWGLGELGVYAFAYRIAKGVTTFASEPLAQVWNAKMYEADRGDDRSLVFGKVYSRILFAYLIGGLSAVLFQDEALAILGKFAGSEQLIAPLILAHFFLVFGNLTDSAIYVRRRTDLKPWIALGATVVMLLSYWILIPRYAGMGAAWATVLGYGTYWLLTMLTAQRIFPVQIEFRRIGIVLASAILVALLGRLIADQTLLKAALLGTLLAGFWFAGLVRDDEKQVIRNLANRAREQLTRRLPGGQS